MSSDRQRWEERYASGRSGNQGPSRFLASTVSLIRGRVLDLAAGAGRNALYLARRGHPVDAIDIALAGLQRACALARAEGLALRAVQADLETFPLPTARYDAVLNIRYLQRSLFDAMRRAVTPGGLILFETFLNGPQQFVHPRNPAHLLQPGELRAAFAGCEILIYEEGWLDTEAEPAYVARLLARRPDGEWD
jgi:tellurite methyltransferase